MSFLSTDTSPFESLHSMRRFLVNIMVTLAPRVSSGCVRNSVQIASDRLCSYSIIRRLFQGSRILIDAGCTTPMD